jgi:hypothetical protein
LGEYIKIFEGKLVKNKILVLLLLLVLSIVLASSYAEAALGDTPPSPPSSNNGGGGSSGSGGSVNTNSAPLFQTYSKPLNSSDGTTIGRLDGKDANSVLLWAQKNGTVGNASYTITMTGELTQQMPDSCWLDINFEASDAARLPVGMDNGLVLAVLNITRSPDTWNYKPNTLNYTIQINNDTIRDLDPNQTYYLVRFDGAGYQTQTIDGSGAGSNPMTFSVSSPGDTGIFTIMAALKPAPSPTPTPVPTPLPSPTPVPENIGIKGITISILTFILGAVATVFAFYMIYIRRKG